MRREDFRNALEAVIGAREWVDARIAELPHEATQVDVMRVAEREDTPSGLVLGLGVLGALAMVPAQQVGQLSEVLDLAPEDAEWLTAVIGRLRSRPGMARPSQGAGVDREPGDRADLENPIVSLSDSPEFYLAANRVAMTVVLRSDSGQSFRIKEAVTGHLATAGILIDRCAHAYELCGTRGIQLCDEELAELRNVLRRTLGCVERICAATGMRSEEIAAQVGDALEEPETPWGEK